MRVREISKLSDRDIDETLEVFEQLFPEQHRIASSDLVAWLNEEFHLLGGLPPLEHCLLIAKRRGRVIGMLKALYCPQTQFGLVSYFGIVKTDAIARKVASKLILRFFKAYIKKRWRKCVKLICEVDDVTIAKSKKERNERIARARLFRDLARRHGVDAYTLNIAYTEPRLAEASDSETIGPPMSILVIPTCPLEACSISRQECSQLLWFLLMRVYGGTQVMLPPQRASYSKYLSDLHDKLTTALPDEVKLQACPVK